jgi:hypothetical protein
MIGGRKFFGLSKRAMKDAGQTARERDAYGRTPEMAGSYTCLNAHDQVVIHRTEDGYIEIGTGDKGRSLAEGLAATYAGHFILSSGRYLYLNDGWSDDIARELIGRLLFI